MVEEKREWSIIFDMMMWRLEKLEFRCSKSWLVEKEENGGKEHRYEGFKLEKEGWKKEYLLSCTIKIMKNLRNLNFTRKKAIFACFLIYE